MNAADFAFLAELLKRRSGIVLAPEKLYLLESRLTPILRDRRIADMAALSMALRRGNEALARQVTDALTTNETFFFRDIKPFETFRQYVLPSVISACRDKRSFRIWCAAAATGQEPYSIAMLLREEAARLQGLKPEIIATDLSSRALERARIGVYSQFEVQRGMPAKLLLKHFSKSNDHWQISPEIRAMITFREHNLLESLAPLGRFEVVFCRNVLIYFDRETKIQTLRNIRRQMSEDGFLFLGGPETVMGLSTEFEPVAGQPGVYRTLSLNRMPSASADTTRFGPPTKRIA